MLASLHPQIQNSFYDKHGVHHRMTSSLITIIGAGNMGSSLIGGLIKDGHPPDKIWASDTSEETCLHLQKTFQVHTTVDNLKAVQVADVVIFAVKPQVFKSIAMSLATVIQKRKP